MQDMLSSILQRARRIIRTTPINEQNMQDEIGKLAYQFFVERGYQNGHDLEDWARAEAIVKSRMQAKK